ncbi:FHA domain-containing protein [Merismopedia glauca]|uniref:Histidine kinase n=1 Tax=Merismopedia glauca CCAP 1448/3 TaxID=1296344 RepID=A0A2T1C0S5_9CYAN|nr:FHA domain-containing protein [Merismopedia glauca]PSB01767.1 histidine kinase [Merismopedia glauca CCAP 1448/3]
MKPDLSSELETISHLLLIEDLKGKRLIHLESASYTLGRDLSNSIVLFSQMVSRHHATLLRVTRPESSTHQFRIVDGNLLAKRSTNGMTVNGKTAATHDLQHGDAIVFGRHVKARYYAVAKMSDLDGLKLCNDDEVSGFLSQLNNPFTDSTLPSQDACHISEAALVRLASFPEMFTHPMWEMDLAGNITYLNPAAISQFPELRKIGSQHPLGSGLLETITDRQDAELCREITFNNRVFHQHIHYIHASELVRTYAIDITERHQLETTLKQRQQRWELLFERGLDLVWLLTPEGRIIEANRMALDLVAVTQPEIANQLFWATKWWNSFPEAQTRWQEAINQAVKGEFVREEMQLPKLNHQLNTLQFSLKPIKDDEGVVVMLICQGSEVDRLQVPTLPLLNKHKSLEERIARLTRELEQVQNQLQENIQLKKQLENALQSSRATNQSLLNVIPDWIFRIDGEGKFVNYRVAPGVNSPIGSNELLSQMIDDVFPQPVAQLWRDRIRQALFTGKMQLFSYQMLELGGSFTYEARVTVSATNEVVAIIRHIHDNDAQIQLEDELTGHLNHMIVS